MISSCCLVNPRGETDLEKPLIKGILRYNEAEYIPRITYSDMFRITNPCYLHISPGKPRHSIYQLDSNACMIPSADGINMLRLK